MPPSRDSAPPTLGDAASDGPTPPGPTKPSARARLVRLGAWLVTGALMFFLLRRLDRHQLVAAFAEAHGWTLPIGFLALLAIYLCDSFAMWKTFNWFAAPLSFKETLLVRGATYLLAVVNYNLGQGAIIYFLNRTRGLPLLRGAATVLLIMGINVLVLLFLTTAGLLLGGAAQSFAALKIVLYVAYPALAVYVVLVILKPRFLASRPLFDILLNASLKDYLRALVVRLPHTAALIFLTVTFFWGFDIHVPLGQAVALLPLVFFIGVLPISVQGLGTSQVALIYFFSAYVTPAAAAEARIVAASLTQQAASLVFQLVLGALCLRSGVGRAVAAPPGGPSASSNAPSPTSTPTTPLR